MLTREPTETKPVIPRRRRLRLVGALTAAVVVFGAIAVALVASGDGGPVAAADAQIEVTFTRDGPSYVGDREIIAGEAEVIFINNADFPSWLAVHRYDTGSAELTDELARNSAAGAFVSPADQPTPAEMEVFQLFGRGANPVEITLRPGTYIIDTAMDMTNVVWRAAVIEVVSD